jgi:hypothetical protein
VRHALLNGLRLENLEQRRLWNFEDHHKISVSVETRERPDLLTRQQSPDHQPGRVDGPLKPGFGLSGAVRGLERVGVCTFCNLQFRFRECQLGEQILNGLLPP